MQFKFCPQCGGMEITPSQAGERCRRCNYTGSMSNGPMDKINEIRKRFSRGSSTPIANSTPRPAGAGLGGLIGASKSSSPETMHVPGQGPTQSEIAERLKALKGKSTSDVEFL